MISLILNLAILIKPFKRTLYTCACIHRQYYETVPCPLKAIYSPLTNILHKKVPFYQEHYVGGITKWYIWKYNNMCPKLFTLFSYKTPISFQFLSLFNYIHIFILCKAGKFWNCFRFLLFFTFHQRIFQYAILPILPLQYFSVSKLFMSPDLPLSPSAFTQIT